ncbi:hypothetical protein V501_02794 [Pseudogymnoascus sp. VKM F-4519 (FW-2642)]|nr:hypothetical protein V501_02794 [Pseudogymnoascus sp. VKM F-4519 (FW-2642)]
MHQQPGDRSCANEAIGGDHFGPVLGYLSKVEDAATADGSAGWFKIYEDSWAPGTGSNGAADYWGTKDMNLCCGRVNMKIPADIPAGDYLLRAEVVALHVAGSLGGAQLYMSCYQLTISGTGSASPSLIQLPGAYAATDPGIKVDIYQSLATYIAPGPTVYGGFTKSAGATCAGVETGTATGPAYEGGGGAAPTTNVGSGPTTAVPTTAAPTTGAASPTTMATSVVPTSTAAPGGCKSPKYGQCGGQGWTGCTGVLDLLKVFGVWWCGGRKGGLEGGSGVGGAGGVEGGEEVVGWGGEYGGVAPSPLPLPPPSPPPSQTHHTDDKSHPSDPAP